MIKLYQGCNEVLNGKICFDKDATHIYEVNDEIVGYFNLIPMLGCINIDYEILEEFRNKGMGNFFLENITSYASKKYRNCEKLLLLIAYDNIRSKKMALKNGYTEDFSILDGECELQNTHVFTKKNEYYKKGL